MINKIIQILCAILFFVGFSFLFGQDYWDFVEGENKKQVFQTQVAEQSQDFSLENTSISDSEIDLWETPSRDLLKKLVREIDEAKSEVFVEVYIFTERDLRDALIRAHKRGVKVQILLENNPYKAPYLNDKHYNAFQDAGLDVKWSDPLNYSLNHSKLLIIDEKAYVATGNFSYATFTKNRDIFIELRDENIVGKLKELFTLDFNHELSGILDETLVVSPYSSRIKIQGIIKNAERSIDFYFPYMGDDELESVFSEQVERGIKLRGIVGSDHVKENTENIKKLEKKGWNISAMERPKLHAKAVLVDEKYLYIGSINFSRYSLDENREIGIIITNKSIISEFQGIFESDF